MESQICISFLKVCSLLMLLPKIIKVSPDVLVETTACQFVGTFFKDTVYIPLADPATTVIPDGTTINFFYKFAIYLTG